MITIISKKYAPFLIKHGHGAEGISKNYFVIFYMYSILFYIYRNAEPDIFLLHLLRRFFESLLFKYSKRSKMGIHQFVFSFLYYTLIIENMDAKTHFLNKKLFLTMNLLQFFIHYCIFKKKIYELRYFHYICEFGIYLILLRNNFKIFYFLNVIWVGVFSIITILNREACVK
jgi:hypothetical protein